MARIAVVDLPARQRPGRLDVELHLLDEFELRCGGVPLRQTASVARLLAFLGICGPSSRAVVAGSLWPDVSDEHARASLRTALWRLGRFAVPIVLTRAELLGLAPGVAVDVEDFRVHAHRLLDPGPDGSAEALATDLADLAGGDLLPGWYDDWVLFERERLRQLRMHALEALSGHLSRGGEHAAAVDAALAALRIEPLRESANRAVLLAHLAEHNVVEALRHYRGYRRLLSEQLGIEPSESLRELLTAALPGQRRTRRGRALAEGLDAVAP